MPVVEQIQTVGGLILNWHIIESEDELKTLCQFAGIQFENSPHHEMRRKQQLVTLLLHKQLHGTAPLSYTATGKPIINDTNFVSISHSEDYVIMMSSQHPCGVDIEKVGHQVRKIRHKFLNDAELAVTKDADETELTRYWSAKEAMFKVYGADGVYLRNNIFVAPITSECWQAVLQDGTLELKRLIRFKQFDKMIIAWTEPTDEA